MSVVGCPCANCREERRGHALDPSHIRPEIKTEVDSFIDMRNRIRNAEDQLRELFTVRMAREALTPAEHRMVDEALGRTE